MPTWTALTQAQGRPAAEALAEACEDLTPEPVGNGVFEIEDGSDRWEVGVYFTEAPDEVALALLAAAHGAQPFVVSELPEVDWVAHVRRELSPVEAGRFFVHGSHDADKVPEGAEALCIEAAMAFGTGHHGTTVGCLLAYDRLLRRERFPRVLDVGTGTGVLAIAAARTGSRVVVGNDIDPVSVRIARENAAVNDARARFVHAAGLSHAAVRTRAPYDLVFANILARPLVALSGQISRAVKPGGAIILSGLLRPQARFVRAAYLARGCRLEGMIKRDAWATLILRRRA